MSTTRNWSPQQQTFLDWCENGTGSCVLEAVAGAGKTTVLIEGGQRIIGQVAYCAYNKDVSEETKLKLKQLGIDWKKMQAGTVHSFGFAGVRKLSPQVKVENYKVANIIANHIGPLQQYARPRDPALWIWRSEIADLVSLAKQQALGIEGGRPVEDVSVWMEIADHYDVFGGNFGSERPPVNLNNAVALAQMVLAESNSNTDLIDYDDMVYLPLVHRVPLWRFDVVMVDEAQDTNPARRALIRAMVKQGGRVIAVGDRHQAIYGFTGADAQALELIKQDFDAIELPLTVSFRCPQAVVAFARQWVDHIEAAPEAPMGSVSATSYEEFITRTDLKAGSAELCRVNAPLVSLAFALIRRGIPCRIEGRQIGNGLKKLLTRWKLNSLDAYERKLDKYEAEQTTRLLAAKKEVQLQNLLDQIETVRVIIDQCRQDGKHDLASIVAHVDAMFGDKVTGMLVLSSIHKAKGREWNKVFWLDRQGTCPSKWARQQWQQQQEKNLMYVAATRAKSELIDVSAPLETLAKRAAA